MRDTSTIILADYLVPVNADIQEVKVILVPEIDDKVNPAGVKGLGELGNVGTNAAVANAVYLPPASASAHFPSGSKISSPEAILSWPGLTRPLS